MLQRELDRLVHKTLIREIEYAAELSRQVGFLFPKKYDVGLAGQTIIVDGCYWLKIKLRINNTRRHFTVRLPDGYAPADAFGKDPLRVAGEMVHAYIDVHPELRSEGADLSAALDRINSTDFADEALQAAAKVVRTSKFEDGK